MGSVTFFVKSQIIHLIFKLSSPAQWTRIQRLVQFFRLCAIFRIYVWSILTLLIFKKTMDSNEKIAFVSNYSERWSTLSITVKISDESNPRPVKSKNFLKWALYLLLFCFTTNTSIITQLFLRLLSLLKFASRVLRCVII